MTTKKSKVALSPKLIEEILQHADGQELFGTEGFFQQLKRGLVNGMLEGEMEHHLGYQKHDKAYKSVDNRRNGHYSKTVPWKAFVLLFTLIAFTSKPAITI